MVAVVRKWEQRHQHGLLILEMKVGRWYWSEYLQLLTFVQTGKHNPGLERTVPQGKNDYEGALHLALTVSRSWRFP